MSYIIIYIYLFFLPSKSELSAFPGQFTHRESLGINWSYFLYSSSVNYVFFKKKTKTSFEKKIGHWFIFGIRVIKEKM